MIIRLRRTTIEICVFGGSFLVVFLTVMQILTLSRKPTIREVPTTITPGVITTKESNPPSGEMRTFKSSKERRLYMYMQKMKLRKKIKMEIQALELAMAKLMKEKSISPEESNLNIQNEVYSRRIKDIIQRSNQRVISSHNTGRLRTTSPSSVLENIFHGYYHQRNKTSYKDIDNIKVPYQTDEYGHPFPFVPVSSTQEIANTDFVRKQKFVPLKHFQDLSKSEEKQMENMITNIQSFEEGNFSTHYEDNFMKVKKQFQEGTALYVNEDLLRQENSEAQDICPMVPDSLVGNITDLQFNQTFDIDSIIYNNSDVMDGGEWKPLTCISRYRVAIIIPYRDRWNHLKVLLHYLIPTLKRQQIHYRIFVVEQFGNETFNKGRIMNAAFREALKLFDFHCVTFHDVDLVPEDDRNMYTCTEQPKHMSHSIDKFKYILPYQGLVGGVLMFKREQFQLVNGYSNMYWGWGAEDDDMTTRILFHGLRIYRPPSTIAKYKMVKHDGRKSSEVAIRVRLLRSAARRSKLEGLNNVKYKLVSTHIEKLFTHFIVNIGTP